ncbi:RNA polymerase sigma-70 factor [Paraflavitalea pollutisoli]|uniref:RNA polymerase sigma-70 factor n=1 Tax=Paraflavitalea pollutisoli TaxID=3034143 RepID=UPI0023ED6DB5|nr:RNA polymerase sigma-70 factor [Paraflavitalea sp. H1-2-19X]
MNCYTPEHRQEGLHFGDLRQEASFGAFFKTHYARLCVYCRFKYGFDKAAAEDIVNTSFGKLWEARQTLDPHLPATPYLYRIVDNQSLNQLKHVRIQNRYAEHVLRGAGVDLASPSFHSVDLKQLRSAIDGAIAAMPEQMRRVFQLSRIEGLKYTEIASQLAISVKTVETQMTRALARLRLQLANYLTLLLLIINVLVNH